MNKKIFLLTFFNKAKNRQLNNRIKINLSTFNKNFNLWYKNTHPTLNCLACNINLPLPMHYVTYQHNSFYVKVLYNKYFFFNGKSSIIRFTASLFISMSMKSSIPIIFKSFFCPTFRVPYTYQVYVSVKQLFFYKLSN